MEKVGLSGDSLISWHREIHHHPIANPEYARENLVSLAQTLVMLYFYYAIMMLVLHYFVLMGWIQSQTIPWMLIESNVGGLLNHLPASMINDRFDVLLAIITTIVAVRLVRRSFEIIKADLHPKESTLAKSKQFSESKVTKTAAVRPIKLSTSKNINLSPRW